MLNSDKASAIPVSAITSLNACQAVRVSILSFHLWYLKAKGWIGRLENGTLAVTVEGVDRTNSEHGREGTTRLLTHPNHTG
jgi:hypothetical protein